MREYIIQRNTPIWTSPSRIRSAAGRLTRLHSSRRGSSLAWRPLRRRHKLRPRSKLHPHHQVRLHRKLRLHLLVRPKLRLQLPLHLEREAKRREPCASRPPSPRLQRGKQGGSDTSRYCNKRSSESRQICDHVSMVSRRANNSSFARNVRPVIIASRFSTFGSANLNT